jgi:hypothetical protein
MLSLLKKKSDASTAPQVPPWHPNFRNYEKLPDIKVVRTAFFVNGAAISLAIALVIYFGFQEWQLHVLRGQLAEAERQIARDKSGSDQAIAMFKKFQTEESKIGEVDTFVKSKLIVSSLIAHLGRTLPVNVAIDSLDLRDVSLVLRLSVRGTRDAGAGYATAYLEQLKADKVLAERFELAEMTSISPNPATGRLAVELSLRLKGVKK